MRSACVRPKKLVVQSSLPPYACHQTRASEKCYHAFEGPSAFTGIPPPARRERAGERLRIEASNCALMNAVQTSRHGHAKETALVSLLQALSERLQGTEDDWTDAFEVLLAPREELGTSNELLAAIATLLAIESKPADARRLLKAAAEFRSHRQPWVEDVLRLLLALVGLGGQPASVEQRMMNVHLSSQSGADEPPSDGRDHGLLLPSAVRHEMDRISSLRIEAWPERELLMPHDPLLLAATRQLSNASETKSGWLEEHPATASAPASRYLYLTDMPREMFLAMYMVHFAPTSGADVSSETSALRKREALLALTGVAQELTPHAQELPSRRSAKTVAQGVHAEIHALEAKIRYWSDPRGGGPDSRMQSTAHYVQARMDAYLKLVLSLYEREDSTPLAMVVRTEQHREELTALNDLTREMFPADAPQSTPLDVLWREHGERAPARQLWVVYALPIFASMHRAALIAGPLESSSPELVDRGTWSVVVGVRRSAALLKRMEPGHPMFGVAHGPVLACEPAEALEAMKASLARLLRDIGATFGPMSDELREEHENWMRAVADVSVDSQGDVLLNALVTRPLVLVRSSLMPAVTQLVSRNFQVDTTLEAIGRCFLLHGVEQPSALLATWASVRTPWREMDDDSRRSLGARAWTDWVEHCLSGPMLEAFQRAALEASVGSGIGSDDKRSTLADLLDVRGSGDAVLWAIFPRATLRSYARLFRERLRHAYALHVLKEVFLEARASGGDHSEVAQVDAARLEALAVLGAVSSLYSENIQMATWPRLVSAMRHQSSVDDMAVTHEMAIAEALKWLFLDEDSTKVAEAIDALVDVVLSLEVLVNGDLPSEERTSLAARARVHISVSTLILSQTLQELCAVPEPRDHHVQLLARVDLNGFFTRDAEPGL